MRSGHTSACGPVLTTVVGSTFEIAHRQAYGWLQT